MKMSLTCTSTFIQIKLNGFARGHVLKIRQRATRKWPTAHFMMLEVNTLITYVFISNG